MLNAMKDAHERNFITLRDMMYAFTIVVALKVQHSLSSLSITQSIQAVRRSAQLFYHSATSEPCQRELQE
jgi:hypothetical protein